MTEVMVSVRMPRSLLKKLKDISQHEDYLDLSEMVRAIARKKWMQYTNPELHEMKKLRQDIELEIRKKSMERVQQEVNKELEKIKSKLRGGGIL